MSCSKKNLVYTTIGHSKNYVPCLQHLFQSIFTFSPNPNFDLLIICDESLIYDVQSCLTKVCKSQEVHIESILFSIVPNALTPMRSSMQKLRIFDIDNIHSYKNVLFIDLDVLCLCPLNPLFTNFEELLEKHPEKLERLQVCHERTNYEDHKEIFWSMDSYSDQDIEYFKTNKILPFNAGCFLFRVSKQMEEHFTNVRKMVIESYKNRKLFFYEQAFMNVYFNSSNLIAYDIINPLIYKMFPDLEEYYEGKIIHFCGTPGNGLVKFKTMESYINKHSIFKIFNNVKDSKSLTILPLETSKHVKKCKDEIPRRKIIL